MISIDSTAECTKHPFGIPVMEIIDEEEAYKWLMTDTEC
jgi:hypothetical protein